MKSTFRCVWVVHSTKSGGIGPVSTYAALATEKYLGWKSTVVAIHEIDNGEISKCNTIKMGLPEHDTSKFLLWLERNPQDFVITNDVATLEPCLPFLPRETLHIINVHDSGRRYIEAAKRCAKYADAVACVGAYFNGSLAQKLRLTGFEGPVATVHNGADFPPSLSRSPSNDILRLLFIGSLDPVLKGVFDLVKIIERLPRKGVNFHLTIVGDVYEPLRNLIENRGLTSRVTWTGRVPHDQCYRYAEENDILLLPSRRESFGMVTIEAMSMGCVPVAWDIKSGTREILVTGVSGFLVPLGNYEAAARLVAELSRDRTRLDKASRAASVRARSGFNLERLAADIQAFVRSIPRNSNRIRYAGKFRALQPKAAVNRSVSIFSIPLKLLRRTGRSLLAAQPKLAHWYLNR